MVWNVKREILSINDGMKSYQRWTGENILWFEFNHASSQAKWPYDEGGRVWYPPTVLPVLFVNFEQKSSDAEEGEGVYSGADMSFTFQISEAMNRFRINPLDTQNHFDDRFAYGTPMQAYTVTSYERQGLVHGTYLTVTVSGRLVQDQEFENDYLGKDFYLNRVIY
jgi:hypothetical protein